MGNRSTLKGQIERIVFVNEETGFTVARLRVPGRLVSVTVVGNLPGVGPGEEVELVGEWIEHPRFGSQFRVEHFQTTIPATVSGIERYLGSGMIKGIGPIMARRLVERFGKETLRIIDREPHRLKEVDGIGEKRIRMIQEAWEAQKEIRDVMVFLQGHGVSPAYAVRIFKHYGRDAIRVVRENPYRLATDIFGVGFLTADRIARNLGVDPQSEMRAEAGILYVLQQLADEGHTYYPTDSLLDRCEKILEVSRDVVRRGLRRLQDAGRLVVEGDASSPHDTDSDAAPVYLARYYAAEVEIARRLKGLLREPPGVPVQDVDHLLEGIPRRLGLDLSPHQREAVRTAIGEKVMVLTGGPGTGKTTIVRVILEAFLPCTRRILLGAPTGRAAKRLSESTGWEAKTLHRMLEWDFSRMGFRRGPDHPLEADLVIVDEASMMDCLLMYHLLRALPLHAFLILVGDVNQLPSVGPGNVLRDIIDSGVVPVVELKEIFRQAADSLIIVNAHRINRGEFPYLGPIRGAQPQDFYFVEREDPEEGARTILELVTQRIPSRFRMDPLEDIQVLTPMHRGVLGSANLNRLLQERLNPSPRELHRSGRSFRVGDRVMQVRNNYEKEIFNGDIGRITDFDTEAQTLRVEFYGRILEYDFSELDELVLAYAVSVHKSQGSEYPAVVMPIHISHYVLLQRNLLYTGVTRAKRLVVLVGSKKALSIGIANAKTHRRYTGLKEKLARIVETA